MPKTDSDPALRPDGGGDDDDTTMRRDNSSSGLAYAAAAGGGGASYEDGDGSKKARSKSWFRWLTNGPASNTTVAIPRPTSAALLPTVSPAASPAPYRSYGQYSTLYSSASHFAGVTGTLPFEAHRKRAVGGGASGVLVRTLCCAAAAGFALFMFYAYWGSVSSGSGGHGASGGAPSSTSLTAAALDDGDYGGGGGAITAEEMMKLRQEAEARRADAGAGWRDDASEITGALFGAGSANASTEALDDYAPGEDAYGAILEADRRRSEAALQELLAQQQAAARAAAGGDEGDGADASGGGVIPPELAQFDPPPRRGGGAEADGYDVLPPPLIPPEAQRREGWASHPAVNGGGNGGEYADGGGNSGVYGRRLQQPSRPPPLHPDLPHELHFDTHEGHGDNEPVELHAALQARHDDAQRAAARRQRVESLLKQRQAAPGAAAVAPAPQPPQQQRPHPSEAPHHHHDPALLAAGAAAYGAHEDIPSTPLHGGGGGGDGSDASAEGGGAGYPADLSLFLNLDGPEYAEGGGGYEAAAGAEQGGGGGDAAAAAAAVPRRASHPLAPHWHAPLPATWALRPAAAPRAYAMARPALRRWWQQRRRRGQQQRGRQAPRAAAASGLIEEDAAGVAAARDALRAWWHRRASGSSGARLMAAAAASLPALQLAGLAEEYAAALAAVVAAPPAAFAGGVCDGGAVSAVGTALRVVGGLLSAAHLAASDGDATRRLLLEQAVACADALLPIAFGSADGSGLSLPLGRHWDAADGSSWAAVDGLSVEWEALSAATGDARYAAAARRAAAHLLVAEPPAGSYWAPSTAVELASGRVAAATGATASGGSSVSSFLLGQFALAGGLRGVDEDAGADGLPQPQMTGNPAWRSLPVTAAAPLPLGGAGDAWLAAARASAQAGSALHAAYDAAAPFEADDASSAAEAASTPLGPDVAALLLAASLLPSDPVLRWAALKAAAPAPSPLPAASVVAVAGERAYFTALYGAWLRAAAGGEAQLAVAAKSVEDDSDGRLMCSLPSQLALGSRGAPTAALAAHQLATAARAFDACWTRHVEPALAAAETAAAAAASAGSGRAAPCRLALRTDATESLLSLYRATGDAAYRARGARLLAAAAVSTTTADDRCEGPAGAPHDNDDVGCAAPGCTSSGSGGSSAGSSGGAVEASQLAALTHLHLLFSPASVARMGSWVLTPGGHPLPAFAAAAPVGAVVGDAATTAAPAAAQE